MESELEMQLDNLPNVISPPTLSEFFLRTQNQSMIGFSPMLSSSARGDPRLQADKTVMYNGLFNGDNSNFQEVPSESLRKMYYSNCSHASTSVVPTSLNCGYDAILSDNRFLMQMENQDNANQWLLSNSTNTLPYETSIPHNNELSLSLATCQGTRDFSLDGFGSNNNRTQPFSREMISGSRYLTSLQQILSEISSFSLEGVEHISYSSAFAGSTSNVMVPSNAESSNTRQEVEAKKSQLLGLLESVDDCYSRCLDEIHTVISAFHAATELDPQLHSCFTLRTISFYYKNLRERISNEILVIGMDSNSNMGSFEKSFIKKQWALQQLKRKDQQLWRPQRGLPERSVSVLRAWMFENFLHPYPKDSEKHLLALKSGLTRSQVSNWFINARVRIWKPLVEDMCLELNKRKGVARQNNEGTSDNNNRMRNQLSIYEHSQRINS